MNYILRYTGSGVPDLKKLKQLFASHDIGVVDDSMLPKMALLDAKDKNLKELENIFQKDWSLSAEKKYKVPDTRRKLKG